MKVLHRIHTFHPTYVLYGALEHKLLPYYKYYSSSTGSDKNMDDIFRFLYVKL